MEKRTTETETQALREKPKVEQTHAAELSAELETHNSEMMALREELEKHKRSLQSLRESTSWRVTAPLRWLSQIVRRPFNPAIATPDAQPMSVVSRPVPRRSAATAIPRQPADDASIRIIDVQQIDGLSYSEPASVAVVMPSIDTTRALETARILAWRAGMPLRIFIVEDSLRQGFIKTLNAASRRLDTRYIVYLAEDAFPGRNWLRLAYDKLEETGKGLLAFNCGKWRGHIAAFGMVRTAWVKDLYGGDLLFSGYKSHRADNELTLIARVTKQFVYLPDAVLMEVDFDKVFRKNNSEASNYTIDDKHLFIARFDNAFDGLVEQADLEPFRGEYLKQRSPVSEKKHDPRPGRI